MLIWSLCTDPRVAENLESRLYENLLKQRMKKNIFLSVLSICALQTIYAQSTNPAPYCDAKFDNAQGFWVDDHITKVTFGTLSNATNGQFADPHYVHYNNLPIAKFAKSRAYDLSVTFEVRGGCSYGVWIDYNQNNIFEPEEKIAGTTGTTILDLGSNIVINKSVTIPATAKAGTTRMRVRIVEDDLFNMNSTETLPCNASNSATDVMDWGETEDYTIEIEGGGNTSVQNSALVGLTQVYPNPTQGNLYITAPIVIDQVTIVNTLGQVVYTQVGNSKQELNVNAALPTGIYILNIIGEGNTIQKKINISN